MDVAGSCIDNLTFVGEGVLQLRRARKRKHGLDKGSDIYISDASELLSPIGKDPNDRKIAYKYTFLQASRMDQKLNRNPR